MKEVVREIGDFYSSVMGKKSLQSECAFPRGLKRKEEKELSSLKKTNAGRGGSTGNFS